MFKNKKFLIGMIHLPPLLGSNSFTNMNDCINKALNSLDYLQNAGFDAVLLENENDKPHTGNATPSQIASMSLIAWEVMKKSKISVGVQLLLNDWKSSFDVAKAVGAQFTRMDIFIDETFAGNYNIIPDLKEIMDYKNKIYKDLTLLTDIQIKSTVISEYNNILKDSSEECIKNKIDGIVIPGSGSQIEIPIEKIKLVKENFPNATILIGGGVNKDNINEHMKFADGAIIGASIKTDGNIDFKKATELVKAMKDV